MKKLLLACAVCICVFTSMIAENKALSASTISKDKAGVTVPGSDNSSEINYWIDSLYSMMRLADAGLDHSVFFNACKGYQYLLSQNALAKPELLTICDYSQRSSKKRLYVLDLIEGKILFNTYVAHGRNSGTYYATSFSNSDESHKSSLGFMITAETYNGDNGYSMRLDGVERGFNSNVRARAVVMHGSEYVNAERAVNGTMMGRSYGCPAVPAAEVKKIVDHIKGGSCFFTYYPDTRYTQTSKILNASFVWPVAQTLQVASAKTPDTLAKVVTSAGTVPVN